MNKKHKRKWKGRSTHHTLHRAKERNIHLTEEMIERLLVQIDNKELKLIRHQENGKILYEVDGNPPYYVVYSPLINAISTVLNDKPYFYTSNPPQDIATKDEDLKYRHSSNYIDDWLTS